MPWNEFGITSLAKGIEQVSKNIHLPFQAQILPYFGGYMEQYLGNLAALQLPVCHSQAGVPFEPPDN